MMIDRLSRVALLSLLISGVFTGCASKPPAPPPERIVIPAASPAEVERALPGVWFIDVRASAEALASAQYKPRQTTVLQREGGGPATREVRTVTERFDPQAYREARDYWTRVLRQSDMQWKMNFRADGTGEHWAVIQTGNAPQATPFQWKLDGWLLRITYPAEAKFRSFEVEMPSAQEFRYPMQPLGDHLVMRPRTN